MSLELLYDKSHLTLSYDADNFLLISDWKGTQSEDDIKSGGIAIVEALKSKGCAKVLNDNRSVTGAWSGGVEWTSKVWTPMMIEAGLQFFAWVYPPAVYTQMSANRAINKMEDPYRDRFVKFDDWNKARDWIMDK